MSPNLIFIYDGECPFCNQFAELIELKSNLPGIKIKNARDHPPEIPNGYDMDLQGAILIKGDEMLHGANAINWICAQIEAPSDALLAVLKIIFISNRRSRLVFPYLLIARRITLFLKGVPRKLSN